MATHVLIHGGAGTASGWRFVREHLARLGHETVAMDLPCDDPSAGWTDYTDAVVEAAGERENLVVVAHSAGGFVAPLVCERLPVGMLVFVAGMVPTSGETFEEWWANTDHGREVDPDWEDSGLFYNDVPPELAEEDARLGEGRENFPTEPWPLEAWLEVPVRYILCRDDRLFPPDFMRRVARERLGVEADEMDGGHCAPLSHPEEIARRLDAYAKETRNV